MASVSQLQYLIAVDREKHFGRAAKACHVAQPSLSMQIQKLEEELGAMIFDRSMKPIRTTETGQEIIKQAKIILHEHKKLTDIATLSSKEPRGDFHLAVIPTLAPYSIPLFLGRFSANYPKVQLKVSEHQTDEIIDLLVDDQIDAGLLVTPLGDDRLIERHLFFEPFFAYVSTEHPLSSRKILAEQDLDDNNLWLLEKGHCFRDQVLKVCSLEHKNKALENVEFAGGNLETLKNLVRRNSGYTLLPELAIMELDKKEKQAYVKKFKKPVPTREVSLVYSRSFLKEPILNSLENEILATLPKNIRSLKKNDLEIIDL